MDNIRIYGNHEVERIIAAIPSGHRHVRFAVYLKDQIIVLQEATVAALVRAYTYTAIHPIRRGVILVNRKLDKNMKKMGFASYQLIEEVNSEDEAIEIINNIMKDVIRSS